MCYNVDLVRAREAAFGVKGRADGGVMDET